MHTNNTEVNAAPDASVARVVWHSQTNQVICSTSAGGVRVMYDPAISDKGAMLSAGRSHSRLNTNMFLPKHAVRPSLCFFRARDRTLQPLSVPYCWRTECLWQRAHVVVFFRICWRLRFVRADGLGHSCMKCRKQGINYDTLLLKFFMRVFVCTCIPLWGSFAAGGRGVRSTRAPDVP